MGDPHNPARAGEKWNQERIDLMEKEIHQLNQVVPIALPNRDQEARARQKEEQADKGDYVLRSVVEAMHKVRGKYAIEPDKIVLNHKDYDEIVKLSYNEYSGWLPHLLDNDFLYKSTLFGVPVERGVKSQVVVNPIIEMYAVPNPNPDELTSIIARPVEVRKEIVVPISSFLFRGHILVRKTRGELINNVSENEMVAIESLREMISETEFRRYIKYGFVLVHGKSGATYQVFRSQAHTKVWKGGQLIEEICVRIRDSNVPLTDNVIAFKTMIEIDEDEFKKTGNVYNMRKKVA